MFTPDQLREQARHLGLDSFESLKIPLDELVGESTRIFDQAPYMVGETSLPAIIRDERDWIRATYEDCRYVVWWGNKYMKTLEYEESVNRTSKTSIYVAFLVNINNRLDVCALCGRLDMGSASSSRDRGAWRFNIRRLVMR